MKTAGFHSWENVRRTFPTGCSETAGPHTAIPLAYRSPTGGIGGSPPRAQARKASRGNLGGVCGREPGQAARYRRVQRYVPAGKAGMPTAKLHPLEVYQGSSGRPRRRPAFPATVAGRPGGPWKSPARLFPGRKSSCFHGNCRALCPRPPSRSNTSEPARRIRARHAGSFQGDRPIGHARLDLAARSRALALPSTAVCGPSGTQYHPADSGPGGPDPEAIEGRLAWFTRAA